MRKTKRIRHIVYNSFVPSPPQGNPERNFPVELPPLGRAGEGLLGWGGALAFYLPALSIISLICWGKWGSVESCSMVMCIR